MKKLEELIDEIKNNFNIEDIIGRYISLEKKGANFVALCPFHQDSNPSLSVSPVKKLFKCFVCGKAGDSIQFVRLFKKLDYIESLKTIATDFNLKWEEYFSDNNKFKNPKIEELNLINKETMNFYKYNLNKIITEGKNLNVINYLKSRNLDLETIEIFNLGWANNNELKNFLTQKGFSNEEILRSGLIRNVEGKFKDYFYDRLIFPIINEYNQVLGFSGRVIKENNNFSKYQNSSETLLFIKNKIIYNLNLAYQEILFKNQVIIVEGFMDVIAFYKLGIKNVVASMGTAFNKNNISKLKKFTSNFVLAFDNDNPGINASLNVYKLFKENKLNPLFFSLKSSKDVDEFFNKNINNSKLKSSEFKNLFIESNLLNYLDFYYQKVLLLINDKKFENDEEILDLLKVVLNYDNKIHRNIIFEKFEEKYWNILSDNLKLKLNQFKNLNSKENQKNDNSNFEIMSFINNEEIKLFYYCLDDFKLLTYLNDKYIFSNEFLRELIKTCLKREELFLLKDKKLILRELLNISDNLNMREILLKLFNYYQNDNLIINISKLKIRDLILNLNEKREILKGKNIYKKIISLNKNDNEEYAYLVKILQNS